MKNKLFFKLIILCFVFYFYIIFVIPPYAKSYATNYTNFVYARIETSGVYLYKTANSSDVANAYFELPKSYFVLLVSNIDNNFYKAQYKDVVGYVKKTEVSPIAEKPQNAYPDNAKFWVYSSDGTKVVSSTFEANSPTITGSVEVMQELNYYGQIIGDEIIKDRGYIWLYCKTKNFSGYLYKGLCDVSKDFVENTEIVTKINEPFLDNDDSYLYNLVNMSSGVKFVIILIVTLPAILLVYLLFKPFNLTKNKPKFKKAENKKKKIKNRTINKIQEIIDDDLL